MIRGASGVSFVAIPHTACATTATATIFNACNQAAASRSPTAPTPKTKAASASAEGRVKPSQAANAQHPSASFDALLSEVTEVGDRPPERGQPHAEEDNEHL